MSFQIRLTQVGGVLRLHVIIEVCGEGRFNRSWRDRNRTEPLEEHGVLDAETRDRIQQLALEVQELGKYAVTRSPGPLPSDILFSRVTIDGPTKRQTTIDFQTGDVVADSLRELVTLLNRSTKHR